MIQVEAEFPEKLQFLFRPGRFKVAYGGRGSAKSWGFARALLLRASSEGSRVLCAREVQKSIKDSVHRLLSDQIQALGLGAQFEVLETSIRAKSGGEFLFAGLSTQTAESIKSAEGIDIVWVEEARNVTKRSWDILIPTIRKPGSEIWVTFNPELDTDETWKRFVLSKPDRAHVVEMNWRDNPWFPEELELERKHCFLTNREDYDWIWEGKCKAAVDGAIYAEQVATANIQAVPHDPLLKTHAVFDLGWNDAMTIGIVQRSASEIRLIDYIEDSHKTLAQYSEEIRNRDYGPINWGSCYLPHDGRHRNIQTGKSAQETMQALGWDVKIVPNIDVESGIRAARNMFPRVYFDQVRTERLIHCLKRYRRSINTQTREPGAPLHDEYSHGADMFRYLALVADELSNETWGGEIRYPEMGIV